MSDNNEALPFSKWTKPGDGNFRPVPSDLKEAWDGLDRAASNVVTLPIAAVDKLFNLLEDSLVSRLKSVEIMLAMHKGDMDNLDIIMGRYMHNVLESADALLGFQTDIMRAAIDANEAQNGR